MECVFKDLTKIDLYSQIQAKVCNLNPIASEKEINNVINSIPPNFLAQKDDLKMICSIFSYYARNNLQNNKGNVIKLFEKILIPMKTHLQGESAFLWDIFGCLFIYKLWFFEEGLISIEDIIQSLRIDAYNHRKTSADFFFPEIIENAPELYEKELKQTLSISYSEENVTKFKELRKKYFKWLRESNDYNDPSYREIETDKLRLSIKTDDIESFQKIVSGSNLSFDSKIGESVLENYLLIPREIPLIEFAIQFNAVKIFKYMYLNNLDIKIENIFNSICQRNYEIIHIVEKQMPEKFKKDSLSSAIRSWNDEVIEYSLENYDYDFFEKSDIGNEHAESVLRFFGDICFSYNFTFFKDVFLPFLKRNPRFFISNVNELLINSFFDLTGYMATEILKHSKIDVNYNSAQNNHLSLLTIAIDWKNTKATEMLLKDPKIDIFNLNGTFSSPFHSACLKCSNMKIIEMFCKHPDFDVNWTDSISNETAFEMCIFIHNTYAMQYLIDNFPNLEIKNIEVIIVNCLEKNLLMTSKILLKYFWDSNDEMSSNELVDHFIPVIQDIAIGENDIEAKFEKIVNELKK